MGGRPAAGRPPLDVICHSQTPPPRKPPRADATAKGSSEEALIHYEKGVKGLPNAAEAHNRYGLGLEAVGRRQEAIDQYGEALRLSPDFPDADNNLGNLMLAQGKLDDAIAHLEKALRSKPDFLEALYNLGNALVAQGRIDEGISHYRQALRLRPVFADANYNLGNALVLQGRLAETISQYEEALRITAKFSRAHNDPDEVGALKNLAWARATHRNPKYRNGEEAVRLAGRAVQLTGHRDAVAVDILAASLAEAGNFEEAVKAGSEARELAISAGQSQLAGEIGRRVNGYQQRIPYHLP